MNRKKTTSNPIKQRYIGGKKLKITLTFQIRLFGTLSECSSLLICSFCSICIREKNINRKRCPCRYCWQFTFSNVRWDSRGSPRRPSGGPCGRTGGCWCCRLWPPFGTRGEPAAQAPGGWVLTAQWENDVWLWRYGGRQVQWRYGVPELEKGWGLAPSKLGGLTPPPRGGGVGSLKKRAALDIMTPQH